MGLFNDIGDAVDEVSEGDVGGAVDEITGGNEEEEQSSQPPASFPSDDPVSTPEPPASTPQPEPEPEPDSPASFPENNQETDTGNQPAGGTDTDGDGSPDASFPDTDGDGGGGAGGSSQPAQPDTPASFPGEENQDQETDSTSVGGVSTSEGREIVKPSGEEVNVTGAASTPGGSQFVTSGNERVTNTRELLQQSRNINQRVNRRQEQRRQVQPFEEARDLARQEGRREQAKDRAFREAGLPGKSVIAGVEIMQKGQQVGETIEETIPRGREIVDQGFNRIREVAPSSEVVQDALGVAEKSAEDFVFNVQPESAFVEGTALLSETGESLKRQEFTEEQLTDVIQATEGEGETSREARESFITGAGTLGTQLGGLAVATPGAVAKTAEEDTPGFIAGGAKGVELVGEEVSEDPGEFVASEAGEEAGEAAVGASLLGPAGAALAATPVPEITPEVKPRAVEAERFLRGDLGNRAEDTRGFIREDETEVLTRFSEEPPGEQEGRIQVVEGRKFTEGGTELSTGAIRRDEVPLSRTEFLKEQLGITDQTVADAIDIGGTRKGQAQVPFTTRETTPETDTTKGVEDPTDLFTEPEEPETDTFTENIDFSGADQAVQPSTLQPDVEDKPVQEQAVDQGQEDLPELERQEPFIQEPEEETSIDSLIEQKPETKIEERVEEPRMKFVAEAEVRPETRSTPDLFSNEEQSTGIFGSQRRERKKSSEFAPSLGGLLGGETRQVTEEQAETLDETVFTGLGQRNPITLEEEDTDEEDLRDQLGI